MKIKVIYCLCSPPRVGGDGRRSAPVGRDHAKVDQDAGLRRGPRYLALWCAPCGGGEESNGEVDGRGKGRAPLLTGRGGGSRHVPTDNRSR